MKSGMRSAQGPKVGCCGYPTSLARYGKLFPVVEVQQTFYQPPLPKTLERWRNQVSLEFEFTLKAWQLITHEASIPTYRRLREKLDETQRRQAGAFRLNETVIDAWERTLHCAQILGSRCILFQCPARFAPTREHKSNLRAFFGEPRRGTKAEPGGELGTFIWEPRGEWKPEEVKELCAELNLVHAVDPFERLPVTTGMGYFRLHGRTGYRYKYTEADLQALLDIARGFQPCYVLFNNISMLEDARRFMELVSKG